MSTLNDEEVKALCSRVNRLVLENEPETFETLRQLAEEGNQRARYTLSVNYGVDILATRYGFEWAFQDVVENPFEFFRAYDEYLVFLFDCAQHGITATEEVFAKFGPEELVEILTYVSHRYIYASKSIADHFIQLPENERTRAFVYVKTALENGFDGACDPMAFYYINGLKIEYNLEKAKELHQQAINAGTAIPELGIEEKIAEKEKEIEGILATAAAATAADPSKAHELYAEAAEKGSQSTKDMMDADYYFRLGMTYKEGQGVDKDMKKAYTYFKQAAKKDHVQAMYETGVCIAEGKGTYKNWEKGLALIQQAADAGNADATTYLAEKDQFWKKFKRMF